MLLLKVISNIKEKENVAKELEDKLNERLSKIEVKKLFDFKNNVELNVFLDSKSGFDEYLLSNSESYKSKVPEWVTGFSNENCVYLVIPNEENMEETIKTGIHELIHLLSYKIVINGNRIRLLEEGLAYYYANQMNMGRFKKLKEDFDSNNIRLFKDLITMNSEEFAKNNGYYYGFFMVKFMNDKYEKEKIIYYIKNSDEFIKDIDRIQVEFIDFMKEEFKKYNL